MLVMSPRIFADSFYNNKDIVFLSAYTLSALTMIQFLIEPTLKRGLIHAIVTAIAIDTRLISIVIPILTTIFLIIRSIKKDAEFKKVLKSALFYLLMSSVFVIVFFPYLWVSPLKHLIEAFQAISLHLHSGSIPYFGVSTPNNGLPWHYLPTWIGISTPFLYVVFFSIGGLSTCYEIVRYKFKVLQNQDQLIDLIFLGLLIGPIIAVASLHTHIYNGWRHLYFVYPLFILIAIKAVQALWCYKSKFFRVGLIAIFIVNFCFIGSWMYANHPLQNLYFNFLAGKNWNSLFEVDYWGLANRTALQKILAHDTSESIAIWPGKTSKFKSGEPTTFTDQLMLENPKNISRVFSPNNIEDSKYIIASNKANYSKDYLLEHGTFEKIDSVKIDGVEILGIFHLRKGAELPIPNKNQKIYFGKSGVGIFYLYDGKNPPINWEEWTSRQWQIPENWGAWTNGTVASIRVPSPKDQVDKIIFKLRTFVTPQFPEQNIEIWIDGTPIKKVKISSDTGQELVIDLPKSLKPSHEVLIEFKGLNPQSPKQLGLSEDNRQIAIGLESMQFQ
jgi:hypothetical protein